MARARLPLSTPVDAAGARLRAGWSPRLFEWHWRGGRGRRFAQAGGRHRPVPAVNDPVAHNERSNHGPRCDESTTPVCPRGPHDRPCDWAGPRVSCCADAADGLCATAPRGATRSAPRAALTCRRRSAAPLAPQPSRGTGGLKGPAERDPVTPHILGARRATEPGRTHGPGRCACAHTAARRSLRWSARGSGCDPRAADAPPPPANGTAGRTAAARAAAAPTDGCVPHSAPRRNAAGRYGRPPVVAAAAAAAQVQGVGEEARSKRPPQRQHHPRGRPRSHSGLAVRVPPLVRQPCPAPAAGGTATTRPRWGPPSDPWV